MKLGERVRHRSRPDLGYGRITRLHHDGHCDVAFATAIFSGLHPSAFSFAEADLALEALSELLESGDLDGAQAHYANECAKYMDREEFERRFRLAQEVHQKRRANLEAARVAKERANLRAQINAYLGEWRFESADELHKASCSAWWPEAEYEALRTQAMRIKDFVQAYPRASLSELDARYAKTFAEWLPADDYARSKLHKLQLRLARLGMPLDEEQQLACARPERHRLIRARAGSGKTRTLAAHAALAIHDEALEPDQVLILAFNKKAAREIGDRVRGAAGITEFRNARTFHSLAWQLADHAGRDLIFDDGNLQPSRRKQSGFVERLIVSIMNPAFRERLYEFFRRELEQLDRLGSNLTKEEYAAFRRSMVDYTLGSETVKSNGEKFIADFLFEHGISYKYEKVWSWDRQDRLSGTAYRPDFSIADGGRDVILEHWAIDPDDASAQVPDWWETSTRDYRGQINAKREFWAKRGMTLLETHAGMLVGGREACEASLRGLLERTGIRCRKLAHDDVVQRVAEAPRTVSRIAGLFMQFISRAKKRGWTVDDVAQVVRDHSDPEPRNRAFHELAVHAYAAYERRLAEQSAMDFDDLLISAAERVRQDGGALRLQLDNTASIAIRDLRWILIDEFQDFSELYYRLIAVILEANPSIRLVVVGDDWQAINGFAGAQLTFFNCFGKYFPGAGEASISTNRRSGRAIVGAGNQLMEGLGASAHAHHTFDGSIDVVAVDKIWLEEGSIYIQATNVRDDGKKSVNWELARALKACADYIAKSVYTDSAQGSRWMPRVLVLARTGRAYNVTLAEFGRRLEHVLRRHPDLQDLANDFAVIGKSSALGDGAVPIELMTAHKAKGKEAGTVIVLEAVLRQFPKVHADNQLFGPFGVTAEDVLAEERRLFYVAVTRAEHRLMLLTENGQECPYLEQFGLASRSYYLADSPKKHEARASLGDLAQAIQNHVEQIDPLDLIRNNTSPIAAALLEQIVSEGHGVPIVPYFNSDLCAEFGWPNAQPPIAILTGHRKVQAEAWRALGWRVHCV